MTTPILNRPARYRWAALKMCERCAAHVARGNRKRADYCLRAARRLNQLAFGSQLTAHS
jgi:hypothetical protein